MSELYKTFLPLQIDNETTITLDALTEALNDWCEGKPEAFFEMTDDGAWLFAPLKYWYRPNMPLVIGQPSTSSATIDFLNDEHK